MAKVSPKKIISKTGARNFNLLFIDYCPWGVDCTGQRRVDGVTNDRQDHRDERLVNIEVERQNSREQGEEADHDDGSVGKWDNSTKAPCPTIEPRRDVGEGHEQGEADTSVNMNANEVIAKEALETNRSVYDIVLEKGLLTKEELDKALDPKNMIR